MSRAKKIVFGGGTFLGSVALALLVIRLNERNVLDEDKIKEIEEEVRKELEPFAEEIEREGIRIKRWLKRVSYGMRGFYRRFLARRFAYRVARYRDMPTKFDPDRK